MFNYQVFTKNIQKIKNILTTVIDNNVISVIFKDGIIIHIDITGDRFHQLYSYMDKTYPKYYYIGKMPHDSYKDLYDEIYRMSTYKRRRCMCKTTYFKGYI